MATVVYWPAKASSSSITAPETVTLADATTTTAPDVRVEQHTTSGTAAAGFGLTDAVELETGGGTTRRVGSDVTSLTVATDTAETAKRQLQLMLAGTLTSVAGFGFESNANAAVYLGAIASGNLIRTYSGNMDLMLGGAAQQIWSPNLSTFLGAVNHLSTAHSTAQGSNIASGTTITATRTGNYFIVTGTTTVKGLVTTSWQAGSRICLQLASGITINHADGAPGTNAVAFLLRAGSNLTTGAVYYLELWYNGTNWIQPS